MRFKIIILAALSLTGVLCTSHSVLGATLDITPANSTATVGDLVELQFLLNTDGVAANATEASLTFPTSLLEIQSVTKQTLFSYWPDDPVYSNVAGTLFFSGGLPHPGYNGTDGNLVTVRVLTTAVGTAQLCESSVIITADTDAGSDISSGTTCATIVISSVSPALPPDIPTVTSSTHPDETQTYANNDPSFEWILDAGVTGFSYVLDQVSNTIPDDISEGTDTTINYVDVADGRWYFHIKAENENGWGDVTHYQVRIDTVLPSVIATFLYGNDTTDTTPDMLVKAEDNGSGITKIELVIDGGSAIDITAFNGSTYTFLELVIGTHTVVIRAYDAAGNVVEIEGSIQIRKATVPEQIDTTINKIVPEPIRRVVENVTKPIQKAIESITNPLNNIVKDLKDNQQVVEDTKKIAEPVSRAAAAIGVASAVATLPVGLVNSVFALFRFGYLLISPLFIGRRGKSWGVVVNSITRKAIPRAVVRVFDTEFSKLKESQITDQLGCFGFIVEPGDYTLNVEHEGYLFPSKLTHLHSFETPEYLGGVIHIDSKKNPNINVTIPMDPTTDQIKKQVLVWKRIRDFLLAFLERINWPMLVIGILVSLWAVTIVPETINVLMLLLYIFLTVLKVVRLKLTVKSFGTVIDAETHAPLGIAAVRVFDAKRKAMVTTRITNEEGKFSALIQPGDYYLIVTKSGYEPQQTGSLKLSKTETLAMDVELKKAQRDLHEGGMQLPPSMNPPSAQTSTEETKTESE